MKHEPIEVTVKIVSSEGTPGYSVVYLDGGQLACVQDSWFEQRGVRFTPAVPDNCTHIIDRYDVTWEWEEGLAFRRNLGAWSKIDQLNKSRGPLKFLKECE